MVEMNGMYMMQAMMAASRTLAQAEAQGSAKTQAEGRSAVLQAEIEKDGYAPDSKLEELDQLHQTAQDAAQSQMGTLGKVQAIMEEAKEAGAAEEKKAPNTDCVDVSGKTAAAAVTSAAEESVPAVYTEDGSLEEWPAVPDVILDVRG